MRYCALPDWLDEVAGDCPKRVTEDWNDRCRAHFPDFAEGAVAISMSALLPKADTCGALAHVCFGSPIADIQSGSILTIFSAASCDLRRFAKWLTNKKHI